MLRQLPPSFHIVIARYNENINWLKPLSEHCIVYNKGDNDIDLTWSKCALKRVNVGRESETYLSYILENYNNLPDFVVFTQGHIADHVGEDSCNYLLHLLSQASLKGISDPVLWHRDTAMHNSWNSNWNQLPDGSFLFEANYSNGIPILFRDWFHLVFKPTQWPIPFGICKNGIFAVHKSKILQHPLSFYLYLQAFVNHHVDPAEGHFLERSWYYIFK